jgi:hypothetical protein
MYSTHSAGLFFVAGARDIIIYLNISIIFIMLFFIEFNKIDIQIE